MRLIPGVPAFLTKSANELAEPNTSTRNPTD